MTSKTKRQQILMFNFFQLVSIGAAAAIFAAYPYAKLYHDLRGGMLKLICFVKCGRFVMALIEAHFDDFNIERLKDVASQNGRQIEAYILMGVYNSSKRVD